MPRNRIIAALLAHLFLIACQGDGPAIQEDRRPDATRVTLDEMIDLLDEAERTPPELLILGMDWEPGPVRSLEDSAEALQNDPELEPLALALQAAGWSTEEAAEMLWMGGAYNSGQPYDTVGARHAMLRNEYRKAIDDFYEALEEHEELDNVYYDRDDMYEAGFPTQRSTTILQ